VALMGFCLSRGFSLSAPGRWHDIKWNANRTLPLTGLSQSNSLSCPKTPPRGLMRRKIGLTLPSLPPLLRFLTFSSSH
jgi:hypothetical protein